MGQRRQHDCCGEEGALREGWLLNQPPLHRMQDRFQPVMRTKLLVDGVEVIPQSRQGDVQVLCDLRGVF